MDLHPDLVPAATLLGSWSGQGRGIYPTIEPFEYFETITFEHVGKPFLAYRQRTRSVAEPSRPLHAESGYWRFPAPGRVEVVVSHPTGLAEIEEGELQRTDDEISITLTASTISRTSTAKDVTAITRRFVLRGETLAYDVAMAAVGQPLQHHLGATLHRD
jgi:hypothetical protein